MGNREYLMVVHPIADDEGGGFIAMAPDLRGCIADGDTPEAAIAELCLAIGEWIDEAQRLGREIPAPGQHIGRAAKRHKQHLKLIESQDRLLKDQDKLLREARNEIERIKKDMDELDSPKDEDHFAWAHGPAAITKVRIGRRLTRVAH